MHGESELANELRSILAARKQSVIERLGHELVVTGQIPIREKGLAQPYLDSGAFSDFDVIVDVASWTTAGVGLPQIGALWQHILVERALVLSDPIMVGQLLKHLEVAPQTSRHPVLFEAASGLHIPVLRALRDWLVPDPIESVFCRPNNALAQAIDGLGSIGKRPRYLHVGQTATAIAASQQNDNLSESASRLSIFCSLAFGERVNPGVLSTMGMNKLLPLDFDYAQSRLGSEIVYLETIEQRATGLRVAAAPSLVKNSEFIGRAGHSETVVINSEMRGPTTLGGVAGRSRAHLIVGDLDFIASGSASSSNPLSLSNDGGDGTADGPSDYYLRFVIRNRPGIVGVIGALLGDAGIHIDQILQLDHDEAEVQAIKVQSATTYVNSESAWNVKLRAVPASEVLPFVISIKQAAESSMHRALANLNSLPFMLLPCLVLRVVDPT